jgi:DNA-binding NarL/FixJ family response regulator
MGIKSVGRLPRRWQGAAGVALVTVLAVAGAYVEADPVHRYGGLDLTRHPPLAAYLLLAVPALGLIWRNSRPVEVLGLAVAGAVGWAALGQIDGAALVPVIVALYWVALARSRRIAVAAGVAAAVVIFVTEGLLGPFGWFGGPNATMWPELLAAGAVGAYVAAHRQWLAAQGDRAARAEQAREEETRRRVDAERMRIARELHDVVAHSMAMINVQATAASMQLAADPASAAAAIQAIRRASMSGLRELRAILDVLRQVDDGSPAVPDLRAFAALVEATSGAGTAGVGRAASPAAAAGRAGRLPHRAGVAHQCGASRGPGRRDGGSAARRRIPVRGRGQRRRDRARSLQRGDRGGAGRHARDDGRSGGHPGCRAAPRRRVRRLRPAAGSRGPARNTGGPGHGPGRQCRRQGRHRSGPEPRCRDSRTGCRQPGHQCRWASWRANREPAVIRVLLADDQALVRAGFRVLAGSAPDIEVVGAAADGAAAVDLARSLRAEVVLMDIRMPGTDGLEATRQIAADPGLRGVRVIILTTFEADEYVFEAIRAGASGFLVKDTEPEDLISAIRVVARGDALLSPSVTRTLISSIAGRGPAQPVNASALSVLTDREREVLANVAAGMSNDEIAAALFMSPLTAKTHVNRMMTKLGARDRSQLVVIAYETGLVRPGPV